MTGGVLGTGRKPSGSWTMRPAGVTGTVATEPRRRGLRLGSVLGCAATPADRALFFGGMIALHLFPSRGAAGLHLFRPRAANGCR